MSFIKTPSIQGKVYAPGYFLAHEECVRRTKEISQSGATTAADGSKYVKMGTPWPSNDGNAVGLVYEDVDVTNGNMPGSVVMGGRVYEGRLPVELNGSAKTALIALGFVFETEPSVTRPNWTTGGTTGGTTGDTTGGTTGDTEGTTGETEGTT